MQIFTKHHVCEASQLKTTGDEWDERDRGDLEGRVTSQLPTGMQHCINFINYKVS